MKTNQTYCNLHNAIVSMRGISRSDVPLACPATAGEGWIVKYLEFHPLSISNDECGEKSSSAPARFLSLIGYLSKSIDLLEQTLTFCMVKKYGYL